ncbi:hypothetical protein [Desulfosoma caldarium]|uniref:Outer membrane surface antigen n=1 Tax=Desulfosoma caldarium TaxID=610254 RepID=A0A3N1UIY9_9BACT|nr:hypothetical protein [Desulfosoma caldarium]ROQ91212.1 hypothetical protein EDC27_2497 [Desulfosoma caldarium]
MWEKSVLGMVAVVFVCLLGFSCALATDEKEAAQLFESFQSEWMKKLSQNGLYGQKTISFQEIKGQKKVVARYSELGTITESRVKRTESKECPFVGVLTYEERICESDGPSGADAAKGPFSCWTRTVTEVFRFANGKWVY